MLNVSASTQRQRSADWYKSATRWTQLTLVENDPVTYDPSFWIDVFKRTRSNAACLSAGGYIAYYPSKIPFHYVSRYLNGTDPFGTLVEGARKLGMHVMARVDFHAVHQDAGDRHPEWISVDEQGNRRRHWAYPDVWVTCAYGDYSFEYMPKVLEEIAREYDIDAIFGNRWQGHGVCYCDACRRGFRATSGLDLPRDSKVENPAWLAWTSWRRARLTRLVAEWDDRIKAIRPTASFIPNMGGVSLMEFDLDVIERYCPFLVVDDQGRRGVEPVWMAGRNGKRMRATFRDRPVVLITSIGPEEEHRWKDGVTSGAEIRAWIEAGITQGMRPWFTKFNGVVPDDRWVDPVADSFSVHALVEPVLQATAPSAEIAVLDPATTLRHLGPAERQKKEEHDLGFYHALVEARLPFEMLSDQAITPERLAEFKVVILADSTCLSNEQCAMLESYVAQGGAIVAAFETSTRNADNSPRRDFGLGRLLGVTMASPSRGPVKNSYVALNGSHPINAGYEGATRIIGGTKLIAVEPTIDAIAPFLYVPDFPDLPMEEVYPRGKPRGAAVVAREHESGGRTVYIPWNIGQIFWEVLAPDHGKLIANAVLWALGKRLDVEVSGPGVLDISIRRSEEMIAIVLQNLTNPMMMKGPMREVYAVGRQEISVAIPRGMRFGSARLLIAGHEASIRGSDGRLIIDVPSIERMEVVQVIAIGRPSRIAGSK